MMMMINCGGALIVFGELIWAPVGGPAKPLTQYMNDSVLGHNVWPPHWACVGLDQAACVFACRIHLGLRRPVFGV